MIGIKGMEMPKNCFQCRFMHHRDWCYANPDIQFTDKEYSELKKRYDGCPLVEIKEADDEQTGRD